MSKEHRAMVLIADIMVPERNLIAVDNENLACCLMLLDEAIRIAENPGVNFRTDLACFEGLIRRARQALVDTKAVGP